MAVLTAPAPDADPHPALVDPRRAVPEPVHGRRGQHDRERGAALAQPRAGRLDHPAAVDRRRLHAGVLRAAAGRRAPRRPVRPAAGPAGRPRGLRGDVRAGRADDLDGPAHRRPRTHGCRGRTGLPGHAGDHRGGVHRRPRARGGDRDLVGGHRVGRGRRASHRRAAPRALLVGLDLPGQRPHRHAGPGRRVVPPARLPGPEPGPARPRRPGHVGGGGRPGDLGDHRGRAPRLDLRRRWSPPARPRCCCWPGSSGSSPARCTRCSMCACSPTPGSARPASRSPRRSSACSGSSSSSRSTCSWSRATAPWRPACGRCRSPSPPARFSPLSIALMHRVGTTRSW